MNSLYLNSIFNLVYKAPSNGTWYPVHSLNYCHSFVKGCWSCSRKHGDDILFC